MHLSLSIQRLVQILIRIDKDVQPRYRLGLQLLCNEILPRTCTSTWAEREQQVLDGIEAAFHPYVRDRGLDWEIHIEQVSYRHPRQHHGRCQSASGATCKLLCKGMQCQSLTHQRFTMHSLLVLRCQSSSLKVLFWIADGPRDMEGEWPGPTNAGNRRREALGRGGQGCSLHKGLLPTWGQSYCCTLQKALYCFKPCDKPASI